MTCTCARMPRVNITNSKAALLYKSYQHVGSRELVEILGLSKSTAGKRLKYAMRYGAENGLYVIDPMKQRYFYIPTEVFLQAFGIDVATALKHGKTAEVKR